jgi:hypothetical protein
MGDAVILYHYTCEHGRAALGDSDGVVVPPRVHSPGHLDSLPVRFGVLAELSWFTDLDVPYREALGLTSTLDGMCDRTRYRYRVVADRDVERWLRSRWRTVPVLRALEHAPGAMPSHWYVSSHPVPVVYDPPSRG